MQKNIQSALEIGELTDEFRRRLEELHTRGLLRHGLAAMALAMQAEMTSYKHRRTIMHSDSLETLMRGVYGALCGDGEHNSHSVQKLTIGYIGMMCNFHNDRRKEISEAFKPFEELLHNR